MSRKLRVCIVFPKLSIGGAETQILYLLKNLDHASFEIHACSLVNGDASMEAEARSSSDSFFVLGFRWRKFPLSFARLVRYLREREIDILHAHLPLADSIGRFAGKVAGVPVLVTTEHGKHLWKNPFHLALERIMNGFTDVRFCVSRDIMEIRSHREGTPHNRLKYVPNAVDTSIFKATSPRRAGLMSEFGWDVSDPLIVSVGRLVEAKDYPLLVRAINLVVKEVPQVRCLIVGEGPFRELIEEEIDKFSLHGHVALPGARRDVAEILKSADIFTLSSLREGLPVSLLEAMAAGCAIVATDAGGIPDAIVDGVNGLLVKVSDENALAEGFLKLLSDRELGRKLGQRAMEDVERRFSARAIADTIGETYKELARKKGLLA